MSFLKADLRTKKNIINTCYFKYIFRINGEL